MGCAIGVQQQGEEPKHIKDEKQKLILPSMDLHEKQEKRQKKEEFESQFGRQTTPRKKQNSVYDQTVNPRIRNITIDFLKNGDIDMVSPNQSTFLTSKRHSVFQQDQENNNDDDQNENNNNIQAFSFAEEDENQTENQQERQEIKLSSRKGF